MNWIFNQLLQGSSEIQLITLDLEDFFQISYLSILSQSCCLLWSLRQSASSSMPEFSICKLCKSCDDFVSLTLNYYMLTTCHHSFYHILLKVWLKDYSVLVALQVNFILQNWGVFLLKIPCVKKSAFSAWLHNYLTTIKVLGVNICQ